MKNKVEDFIYTGGIFHHLRQTKAELDPSRCSFSVAEYGKMTDWHQCNRKIVEKVEGYGFCKAHAFEVKRRLGIEVESKIVFAASFENGSPELAELSVTKETENTITIQSIDGIIGSYFYLSTGNSRKDSHYLRKYKFFNTVNAAHLWLVEQAEKYVTSCENQVQKAIEVYNKLRNKGL